MKHVFLKFPSSRTFLALKDISKVKNLKRNYIFFFDEKRLLKYFDVNLEEWNKKDFCFYAAPSDAGKEITKREGFFNICLCTSKEIIKFFREVVFPTAGLSEGDDVDYIYLTEEDAKKSEIIEIPFEFNPLFFIQLGKKLIPVSFSPFSSFSKEIDKKFNGKQVLSFGNESKFTIAYLDKGKVIVTPNFGELESLYQIDAMDLMVNSIMGHMRFKEIIVLKDFNNYSMITDYTRKFREVKSVSHIFSHMANVLFDNKIFNDKVIGIVYDSISYDEGDQIRGSEILYGKLGNLKIAGGWKPVPLPGGDIANIEPWRIALAIIKEVTGKDLNQINLSLVQKLKNNKNYAYIFNAINDGNISYFLSSSMHHIVSALGEILSYTEYTYDYEYFEDLMDQFPEKRIATDYYDIQIVEEDGILYANTCDLFKQVIEDLSRELELMSLIHKIVSSIAITTSSLICKMAQRYKQNKVCLAGQYFKHPHFLSFVSSELEKEGLEVLLPKELPIDDSGVAIGQLLYYCHSQG